MRTVNPEVLILRAVLKEYDTVRAAIDAGDHRPMMYRWLEGLEIAIQLVRTKFGDML